MKVQSLERPIRAHPFFDGLEDRHIKLVAGCAKNVRFRAGQVIFKEGDPASTFYLVRSGRVSVELAIPGKPNMALETLVAGDVLGWSWLFPPFVWHFDARAVDATSAIAFDGACLRKKCDRDPALGYALMQRFAGVMLDRLMATRLKVLDVYGPD